MMGLGSYFLNNAAKSRQDCRAGLACWVDDPAVAEWGLSLCWSKAEGGKTRRFLKGHRGHLATALMMRMPGEAEATDGV